MHQIVVFIDKYVYCSVVSSVLLNILFYFSDKVYVIFSSDLTLGKLNSKYHVFFKAMGNNFSESFNHGIKKIVSKKPLI